MSLQPPEGKQLQSLFESDARINIWDGSVRSGKTVGSIFRWLKFIREAPEDGEFLMTGKTVSTLRRNIIKPMSEITGENYEKGFSKKEITVLGRKVQIEGANDDRAEGRIRGLTLAGHYGDELTLWPEGYFKQALARMSVAGAKFFGTTNPDSPNHYLKKEYLDNETLDLKRFHFSLTDNPFLSLDYIRNISKEYQGVWKKRFISGLWVQAEGAIYDMFSDHLIVKDPPKIVQTFGAIDYGTSNPFVFLVIGIGKDAKMYVIDEYRWDSKAEGRQLTDAQYAERVKNFLNKNGHRPEKIYLDPSAASFYRQLVNDSAFRGRVVKADNTVLDGIRDVSTLYGNELLLIAEKCEGLINENYSYLWDAKAQQRGEDKPLKQDDHAPDAIRYFVRMSRNIWGQWLKKKQSQEALKKLTSRNLA